MDTKPHQISKDEWAEIITVPQVREGWGLDGMSTPEEFASVVYGVKFNFTSGAPGYVGDLYILYGDCLGNPPVTLYRDERLGHLVVDAGSN